MSPPYLYISVNCPYFNICNLCASKDFYVNMCHLDCHLCTWYSSHVSYIVILKIGRINLYKLYSLSCNVQCWVSGDNFSYFYCVSFIGFVRLCPNYPESGREMKVIWHEVCRIFLMLWNFSTMSTILLAQIDSICKLRIWLISHFYLKVMWLDRSFWKETLSLVLFTWQKSTYSPKQAHW